MTSHPRTRTSSSGSDRPGFDLEQGFQHNDVTDTAFQSEVLPVDSLRQHTIAAGTAEAGRRAGQLERTQAIGFITFRGDVPGEFSLIAIRLSSLARGEVYPSL